MFKVSVCLASYNGQNFIFEQVESIFASLKYAGINNFEILISDDGSDDKTLEVLKFFGQSVSILYGPKAGLIKNFEFLLNHATGDVIFLSDQDDIWLIEKVSKCLEALNDYDLVVTDAVVVNRDLSPIYASFFQIRKSGSGFFKNLIRNSFLGCCMCFKRVTMKEIGCLPFPENIPMHDWWVGLLFEKKARVFFLKEKLLLYRRHGKNVSPSSEESNYSFLTKLKWRAILFFNTMIR